jgi:hypothetical protein
MKRVIMLLMVCLTTVSVYAQRDVDSESSWSPKERGYLGLGFGGLGWGRSTYYGNYFSVGVTPLVGYMLAKNLSAGLAFEYQYTSYSDLKLRIHQYGGYPFLRYNIQTFFLQVDYDLYSIQSDVRVPDSERVLLDRFFGGVGYSAKGRGRAAFNILLSYDFLYTNTSPFSSPLSVRAFMTF